MLFRSWPKGKPSIAWPYGGTLSYELESDGLIVYEFEEGNTPPHSYVWQALGEYRKRIESGFTLEEIGGLQDLMGPLVAIATAAAMAQYAECMGQMLMGVSLVGNRCKG